MLVRGIDEQNKERLIGDSFKDLQPDKTGELEVSRRSGKCTVYIMKDHAKKLKEIIENKRLGENRLAFAADKATIKQDTLNAIAPILIKFKKLGEINADILEDDAEDFTTNYVILQKDLDSLDKTFSKMLKQIDEKRKPYISKMKEDIILEQPITGKIYRGKTKILFGANKMEPIILKTISIKNQQIISDKGEKIDFFNVCITEKPIEQENTGTTAPSALELAPISNVKTGGFIAELIGNDTLEINLGPQQTGGFINSLLHSDDSDTSDNLELCK